MQYIELIVAALLLGLSLFLFIRSLRSKSQGECTSCAGCQTKCPDEEKSGLLLVSKDGK